MRAAQIVTCGLLGLLAAVPAHADFEISLREGGTMIVKSYQIDGDKLVAYRASGTVEIAFSRVVNVRDLRFDAAAAPRSTAPQASAPSLPASTASSPAMLSQDDAGKRDDELTRAIILARRDLSAAQYRGDAKDAIGRRKAQIARLEAERAAVHKVVVGR